MRTPLLKGMRWGLLVIVMALLVSAVAPGAAVPAAAAATPATGIICTWGSVDASLTRTFNLTTDTGYIMLPDANTAFMWGFTEAGNPFQHPGPVLCANKGDTVTVILQNTLGENTSIMFPGQGSVLANGAPAQPEFDGTGKMTSLTTSVAAGSNITYSFVASRPGTYLYESGTDAVRQVNMGLFGALIVYPNPAEVVTVPGTTPLPAGLTGVKYMYNRSDSAYTPEEEFLVLLSEIDPYLHQAVENGQSFNMNNYHPRYWLINGRGFPDSVADNFASYLPSQPYGALARIHPYNADLPTTDQDYHPYGGAIRYVNVATQDFPFHPHGNNGLVIGRDGNPLEGPVGQDLSFEKFTINIGPGQTWDIIFRWYDAEGYDSATNNVPVTVPSLANMTLGMFFSGSPYLGEMGTMPPGMSTLNQCGEYYIISHNHALFQITSWGVTMSGPATYLRIDPPYAKQMMMGMMCPPFP
jgi:FtsP/CotA-like multicopper oxidase with cupredoxin domain